MDKQYKDEDWMTPEDEALVKESIPGVDFSLPPDISNQAITVNTKTKKLLGNMADQSVSEVTLTYKATHLELVEIIRILKPAGTATDTSGSLAERLVETKAVLAAIQRGTPPKKIRRGTYEGAGKNINPG